MERVAVFVDAGYVFAQGSVCINGRAVPRHNLILSCNHIVGLLRNLALEIAPQAKLLRIYWYDGATPGSTRSTDHDVLTRTDDVKLRLGFINRQGQQKGVDSLIVTDLIELARLKSIDEALLVSGDEDVRIGVQIAQNYGVRVHLLGLHPARGWQSAQLMDEADTTLEWAKDKVSLFLKMRPPEVLDNRNSAVAVVDHERHPANLGMIFDQIMADYKQSLLSSDLQILQAHFTKHRTIPSDFNRSLLLFAKNFLKRTLDVDEKEQLRQLFRQNIKSG